MTTEFYTYFFQSVPKQLYSFTISVLRGILINGVLIFALPAVFAAIYTRIKATVASTMYDISRANAYGYFDSVDADGRYEARKTLNAQRIIDYKKRLLQLLQDSARLSFKVARF